MSIPLVESVEYYAYDENGDDFAWEETLEAALAHEGVARVEQVTRYITDYEEVWTRTEGNTA